MKRSALAAALVIVSMLGGELRAVDNVEWVGGPSGEWNTGDVWKNTTDNVTGDAQTIFGQGNGSDGNNNLDPDLTRARNITIGGGSVVEYFGANSDFRIRQGSNLTIKEGAVWVQQTDADYEANAWTQMDPSLLLLDNGTYRRAGDAPDGSGGGIVLFGSYRADANYSVVPGPAVINVRMINGGKIENNGQVWFGAEEEHPADGMVVSFEINNGSMDLTGGDIAANSNGGGWGDVFANLAFWYGFDSGANLPKGEKYEINFKGPGTITVDTINAPAPTTYDDIPTKGAVHGSGIRIYRQDSGGIWSETKASYEDLWNEGILKSKGRSGLAFSGPGTSGLAFSNFFNVTGDPNSDNYTLTRKAPTAVTWDGGTGNWGTDLKWNTGQDAATVMGTTRGTDGGHAIVIDGSKPGGANVTYDQNSDFQVRSNNGISSVTVNNGGTLSLHSNNENAEDGNWTRWGIDLNVDGGTFRRTRDGVNSKSGGAWIVGGYDQKQGMEIDINVTNGGRIENHGQMWFGAVDSDDALGLEITMTINNGTVDLTGGDSVPLLGEDVPFQPDLLFAYTGRPSEQVLSGEKYIINFTGPGSLTVDHSGIYTVNWDIDNTTPTPDARTYQELWDLGILQANGLSGLTGATFSDYFTTTGALGADNYTLTSKASLSGDFDLDGDVDGNDFLRWQRGAGVTMNAANLALWKANFGAGGAIGAVGAVPEPSALAAGLLAFGGLFARRGRRAAA